MLFRNLFSTIVKILLKDDNYRKGEKRTVSRIDWKAFFFCLLTAPSLVRFFYSSTHCEMWSWILINHNAMVVNSTHNKINFQWVVLDKAGYVFLCRHLYCFWSRSFKEILGCRIQKLGVHTKFLMNIIIL